MPCVGYGDAYGAGIYGKRAADPQICYGYGIGLKSAPCVNAYNHPVPYNGYAGVYGAGIYGKRDADPQILGAGVYGGYAHAIAATHPLFQCWTLP